jgi:hypothetical protein
MSQTLIIHVNRINKIPFLQSRASLALTATTLSIMAFGMWLPYSPMASALGFTHLPRAYWPILMLTLLGYVGLTQIVKVWHCESNGSKRRFPAKAEFASTQGPLLSGTAKHGLGYG